MVQSLLRESMDEAQIPRGRDLTPAGVAPEVRTPLILVVDSQFELERDEELLSEADAIVICAADPAAVRRACAAVCRRARRGQTIVLASFGYLGATRDLLVAPLAEAGFEVGRDICVACAPERPGPGDSAVPRPPTRVLGATGSACAEKAHAALASIAPAVQIVSSPEAAELTEVLAEAMTTLGLDPA